MSVIRNLGKATGQTNFATVEYPVKNGVTVNDGDFVKLVSGRVTNETIADGRLLGTVNGTDTQDLVSLTARETTVGDSDGSKKVIVELASDNRYELEVNANLATTAEGRYFNLTGNTGEQKVDNASSNTETGQLLCLERIATAFNDDGVATEHKKGVFVVSSPQTQTNPSTS